MRSALLITAGLLTIAISVGGAGPSAASLTARTANPDNTFSAASSFCTSPGTQTVKATRDSYVDQSSPSQNYGGVTDLFVQSKSGSANRRTFVGFSLPTPPSGCSVTGATLRLYATSSVSGRTLQAYLAGSSWTEGGITWNNAPAPTGTASTTASGSGWRSWSVTSQVQVQYSPGPNDGFLIKDATESSSQSPEQKFQPREGSPNSQDPELVLTFG